MMFSSQRRWTIKMATLCLWTAMSILPAAAHADPLATEAGQRALKEERFEDAWRILEPLATAPKAPPDVRFWAAEAASKLQLWQQALDCLSGLQTDLVAIADEIYARKARWHTALGAYE